MSNYTRTKGSLLFLLGKVQEKGDELHIKPLPDGTLSAELIKKDGKVRTRFLLDFPNLSGEQALPLVSKVEWDETTHRVQQRFPAHYAFRRTHTRYETFLAGEEPKRKRFKAHPWSDPTPKKRRTSKRARTNSLPKKFTSEDIDSLFDAGMLDFLKPTE